MVRECCVERSNRDSLAVHRGFEQTSEVMRCVVRLLGGQGRTGSQTEHTYLSTDCPSYTLYHG